MSFDVSGFLEKEKHWKENGPPSLLPCFGVHCALTSLTKVCCSLVCSLCEKCACVLLCSTVTKCACVLVFLAGCASVLLCVIGSVRGFCVFMCAIVISSVC